MLAVMMPEGIRAEDLVVPAPDTDVVKDPVNRIDTKKRLANPLCRNTMPKSSQHSIEHNEASTSIMGAQPNQQHVKVIVRDF